MPSITKKYDLILFGVTGFTGKLAAEYLLVKYGKLKWACSARDQAKAEGVLKTLAENIHSDGGDGTLPMLPDVLQVDLLCGTSDEEAKLRHFLEQTKVVVTCSGPFELYGKTLVKLCAELGVHYADVTGETDFFREMITLYDAKARETGACIISHCGNDCIPCDLTVLEMFTFAKDKGYNLKEVMTYAEYGEGASWSGGTLATAKVNLGKDRSKNERPSFDPLYTTAEGTLSEYTVKNISPKKTVKAEGLDKDAGPWIMGPVMVNCVKRSNALLGYSKDFKYGDAILKSGSLTAWLKQLGNGVILSAALTLPGVFDSFLPQPGQGPDRQTMEEGSLTLHGIGTMTSEDGQTSKKIQSKFRFNKDVAYLYTSVLLVETGMLLVEKANANSSSLNGGCLSPAAALGRDLTRRILKEMDTTFEVKEVDL